MGGYGETDWLLAWVGAVSRDGNTRAPSPFSVSQRLGPPTRKGSTNQTPAGRPKPHPTPPFHPPAMALRRGECGARKALAPRAKAPSRRRLSLPKEEEACCIALPGAASLLLVFPSVCVCVCVSGVWWEAHGREGGSGSSCKGDEARVHVDRDGGSARVGVKRQTTT